MYHSPDSQHKIFSGIKVRFQITFIRILINLPLIVSNMKLYKVTNYPVQYKGMTSVQLYSDTFNPGPMFEYSAKKTLLPSLKYSHRVILNQLY